jgi:hypothetical protein
MKGGFGYPPFIKLTENMRVSRSIRLVSHNTVAVHQETVSLSIVHLQGKGRGIVTNNDITQGETILEFGGHLVTRRNLRNPNAALQIDEDLFLESDGAIDESLNHSCRPNCYVDFDHLTLVALKNIRRGNELTFNYNASEYDLIDQGCAFVCSCGSETCIGRITGFKHAPLEHKKTIEPLLAPFLRRKMEKETCSDDVKQPRLSGRRDRGKPGQGIQFRSPFFRTQGLRAGK